MINKRIIITFNALYYSSNTGDYMVDLDTDENNGYYIVYRWDSVNNFVEQESYKRLEDAISL